MKYFLDTEFIEDGQTIDLISIGIVAEDGREYYAINVQCQFHRANDWVKKNVLVHLPPQYAIDVQGKKTDFNPIFKYRCDIKKDILEFIGDDKPEFWAYYADYDWVVFCQLFGKMLDLPEAWPKFCMDIKQLAVMKGNPKLPEQDTVEHHALSDAGWNKQAYDFLMKL